MTATTATTATEMTKPPAGEPRRVTNATERHSQAVRIASLDVAKLRVPLTNLARAAMQAGKDIKSARIARERLDAQRLKSKYKQPGGSAGAGGGVKPVGPEQKKARRSRPVFEFGPSVGREVPSFASAALLQAAFGSAAEPRSAKSMALSPTLSSPSPSSSQTLSWRRWPSSRM